MSWADRFRKTRLAYQFTFRDCKYVRSLEINHSHIYLLPDGSNLLVDRHEDLTDSLRVLLAYRERNERRCMKIIEDVHRIVHVLRAGGATDDDMGRISYTLTEQEWRGISRYFRDVNYMPDLNQHIEIDIEAKLFGITILRGKKNA